MKLARRAALAFDGVERADADGPPTAFRIWRAGDNTTDHGPTLFTERSAALLLEQQARRGNRFNVDVNHLSLDSTAPLENQRAVGWFDIEVRDGELWAVNVEWTDTVRQGLCKTPPEWRYHSPAYDVDSNTGEVLGLTNLALTNNPATWSVTALATCGASKRNASRMKLEDIKAAFEGADEDKKAAAWKAIASALASVGGEKEPDGDEPKKEEGDEPEKKEEGDEPEKKAKKAEADEPEKADSEDDADKKDTAKVAASMLAKQDERIRALESELAKRRKQEESEERKSLIASRVMSAELAKTLSDKPLTFVRDVCAALPVKTDALASRSTSTVQATRGESQQGQVSALPPDEKRQLDERMGLIKKEGAVTNEGVHQVFATVTPSQARKLAAKGGK